MRATTYYIRRLTFAALLIGLILSMIHFLRSGMGYNNVDDNNLNKLLQISELIKNYRQEVHKIGEGTPACKFPELNLYNPEIMKFIHKVAPLQCSPEDWVKINGSKLFIDTKLNKRYGSITCALNEIIRIDDYNYKLSETVETSEFYILQKSDFAEVKCISQTGKQWHSVLAAVQENLSVQRDVNWNKVSEKVLPFNILMFGFDSLSRKTFERKLPRSFHYLRHILGSLVLEGYNIVGDGTPQALIPILTGQIELELPETRKRMGNEANYVDIYPMIWKDYKQAGFITSFMEDVHHIGTFTYRLKGFDKQPTDHYMRTFYLAASPHFKYFKPFCMSGIPRHMVMMNHIKSIFDKYKDKPKFTFGFHGELSHDSYNDIGVADGDLLNWIKALKKSGHLNSTIFILMSDHGHRFADIRNTLQGKQEERLPFFSFTFPPWFKQAYPLAYANFIYNTQLLSTPFDIHATLKHILNFETPKNGDLNSRGISLFDKIPIQRTCSDAFIEPHWCACLSWSEVSTNQIIIQEAALYFIEFLNSYTKENRNICEQLYMNKVLWAAKLIPTKGLLQFEKSRDTDGFVAELSAKTRPTIELYQVKVETLPGHGLYEASISHNVNENVFSAKISDISRINMYGSQAKCVEDNLYHLRKYCYCKV